MAYDLTKEPTFAHVPRVSTENWDDFGVFRETCLAELFDAQAAEVFRDYGNLQLILMRETLGAWPFRYVDAIPHRLHAVMADLRYLQGFLVSVCDRSTHDRDADVYQGGEELALQGDELREFGNQLAQRIGALADEIDRKVGGWEFKAP